MIAAAMGPDADLVAKRMARGCRCFAVWMENSLAGYGWLSTGPEWIGEIQLELTPGPGEGYIWNCVTIPHHRRKGVFGSLVAGIREVARGEGLKRLWIGSVAIPAEKAVGPSGFVPALAFQAFEAAGTHVLFAGLARNGDAITGSEGFEVLGIGPGLRARRSRHRRH